MSLLVPLSGGGAAGWGTFVIVRSLSGADLHRAVGRIAREPAASTRRRGIPALARLTRLGLASGSRPRDLAVTGRSSAWHAATRLSMSLVLAGAAIALALVAPLAGWSIPVSAAGVLALGALVTGFVVPDVSLTRAARQRRRDFAHALSSYLDLVNVLLAGGAGIETALSAAAAAGDGWVFAHLRESLLRARTTRRSVWACFAELGAALGVDDLAELSASIQLAGEQGARVATSLSARAGAMRDRLLARIEADAQAASERMGLPTVLMFVGFLFLLGYPAVQIILGRT